LPGIALAGGAAAALAAGSYRGYRVRPSVYLTIGIVLSIFSGVWKYLHLTGLPIKPDRLLIAVGLVLLAFRAPGARDRSELRVHVVHVLMIIAATYAVISAFLANTLFHSDGLFGLLDRFGLVPYLIFVFAPVAFETERDRDILLLGLTVCGAYLGLTALFETAHVSALVVPNVISNPNIGIHIGRARGPFLEAVANGLAMYGCGCVAAAAAVRWKGWGRAFAIAVTILCTLGVLFTVTRAVWIGAAAGTLVVLISFGMARWLVPALLIGGLAVGGAFLAIPSLSSQASQRASDQLPIWDRDNINAAAIRMVEAKPLLGWGWDNFVADSPPFFRQAGTYPVTGLGKVVHNVVLSNAVELGLVGTGLWLLVLVVGLGGAIVSRGPPILKPWRMIATAYAVCFFVVAMLGPLPYTMPNLLLWTFAGVALAGWRSVSSSPAVPSLPLAVRTKVVGP
jgi:putative inorganic carbon (HCO3(-)) transporter